jgi:anti-sigma regulatory factor (Ser/Thr protein kinase)
VGREHTILPARSCAVGVARRYARGVFERWGVPAPWVGEALVVVSELGTNAVVHGASPARKPVTLTLEFVSCRVGAALLITVRDVTPVSLALHLGLTGRQPSPCGWASGGRGLAIVRGLADRVEAHAEPDGKAVSALFLLLRPEHQAA